MPPDDPKQALKEETAKALIESNARVASALEALAAQGARPDPGEDESASAKFCRAFPGEQAKQERERQSMLREGRGLPTRYFLLQLASNRSVGCFEAVENSRGVLRLMKPSLPPGAPAGTIPTTQNHPDEVLAIFATTLAIVAPAVGRAAMDLGREHLGLGPYVHANHYGVAYKNTASTFDALLGRNSPACQAIYTNLTLPLMRLNGMPVVEARKLCSYWHELQEGEPIPQSYLELTKPTGEPVTMAAPLLPPEEVRPAPTSLDRDDREALARSAAEDRARPGAKVFG